MTVAGARQSSEPLPSAANNAAAAGDATRAWRRRMSWPEWLNVAIGAGMLGGVPMGQWLRLLAANRFAVWPRYWPRAAVISAWTPWNSFFRWRVRRRFGRAIESTRVPPPVFILGHWRSGTTHLHNLFAVDERFAYPNLYQCANPHTFLATESFMARIAAPSRPDRIVDAIRIGFDTPFEDEFAIGAMCTVSPYLGLVFPRRAAHYDRYLTFEGVPPRERAAWQAAFVSFLKALTVRYDRPVVLKSPSHTGRLAMLLEMFPDAKFLHIHRHPYEVLRSTRHLMSFLIRQNMLQRFDWNALDDRIIGNYARMYDAYLAERSAVPAGQLHEIAYADLVRDPIGELERAYAALHLPDFAAARPNVEAYLETVSDYKKNRHVDLPADLRERVDREWARFFEAFEYSMES